VLPRRATCDGIVRLDPSSLPIAFVVVPVDVVAASVVAGTAIMNNARFAHDVYFALKDPSHLAKQKLVSECHRHLAGIESVVFLAAGMRDAELQRDVNDREYDVSLHVFFEGRAGHDAYQEDPAHLAFIAANVDTWKAVRVFDSNLSAASE
jgi:hypothetical protein